MNNTKKQTELQWNKEGYVLNEGATGSFEYVNGYHDQKVYRYASSEVHEDKEKLKRFDEIREKWHTEFQWLSLYRRIPNKNAVWLYGYELNKCYKSYCSWSFGSNYLYCFIDDTHDPKTEQELIGAFKACNQSYLERSQHEI